VTALPQALAELLDEIAGLGVEEGALIHDRRLLALPAMTARRAALASQLAERLAGTALSDAQRAEVERRLDEIRSATADHLALLGSTRDELADEIGRLTTTRRARQSYTAARRG